MLINCSIVNISEIVDDFPRISGCDPSRMPRGLRVRPKHDGHTHGDLCDQWEIHCAVLSRRNGQRLNGTNGDASESSSILAMPMSLADIGMQWFRLSADISVRVRVHRVSASHPFTSSSPTSIAVSRSYDTSAVN